MGGLTCFYGFLVLAGGAYIAFSFIVGEIIDFGEEAGDFLEGITDSFGEFLGDIGDFLEGLTGAAEAADVDVGEIELPEIGELEHEFGEGPSPFSLRTIAMFAAGFGAGGLVGTGLGLSEPLTLIPAFGFGGVSGVITWIFLRFLYASQATTSIQPPDYKGLIGRVTVPIPEGKLGQVTLTVKMRTRNLPARSENGAPIPAQARVQVISIEGGMLIVKRLD